MRACKNLIRARKSRQEEQKERIHCLEREVMQLEEVVRELQHRVTQLEIARKLGN